jgi:ABC-2 type transport system permease protein
MSELEASLLVARNEFRRVIEHPLIIAILLIMLILVALNGINGPGLSGYDTIMSGSDVFIKVGLSDVLWNMSTYCTMAAMFIGLVSVAGDKSTGSLNILLSKPLYKRDILAGKFLGVISFIFLLITVVYASSSLLLMLFFRAPLSFEEFMLRLSALILILFLESSLAAGIAILLGLIFHRLLDAALIVASIFYLEWFTSIPNYPSIFNMLNPTTLYFKILWASPDPRFTGLVDTHFGFTTWAVIALPYIILLVLYLLGIVLVNTYLFTRSEDY